MLERWAVLKSHPFIKPKSGSFSDIAQVSVYLVPGTAGHPVTDTHPRPQRRQVRARAIKMF